MSVKITLKEISREYKISEVTGKNYHDFDSKSICDLDKLYWDISLIIFDEFDPPFNPKGIKWATIYGKKQNEISDLDEYSTATFLKNEELQEIINWQESLGITDFNSYEKYYSNLSEAVKEKLEIICDLTKEKQLEMILELFNFYKTSFENGNWILIYVIQ